MLFPAAAVWTPLCVAAQSTYFSLLSIFRLHGCHFSGWGSRVGGLLISETSIFTIDNGDEARKRRTTEPWRSPPNRQRWSAFKKARLLWQKKFRNPLLCQHISEILLSSSLHRTSAVAVQSHRQLAFARRTWEWYMYDAHLQRALACGWKGKTTDFRAKKGKLLSQGRIYLKLKCKKDNSIFKTLEKRKLESLWKHLKRVKYTSGLSFFGMDYRSGESSTFNFNQGFEDVL